MAGAIQKLKDIEAEWMAKATQAAIDAMRDVIKDINGRATISSLSERELGWIGIAAICAWIRTKSEQAVAEGTGYEETIRAMDCAVQPWDAGAVTSILPALGDIPNLPWDKPVSDWSRDEIVRFTWNARELITTALMARDEGAPDKIVQKISREVAERELNARNGGSLMSRKEMNDDIPF